MTANVQSRLTVKQAAEVMDVSERLIYMVRKVLRLRPDLRPEMEAGRLSAHAALRIAERRPKASSWDRLVKAWNSATKDQRAMFLAKVTSAAESNGHDPEPAA